MGRRALGKSDPRLDLTSHLVTAQRLPQLWDQEQLFPTSHRMPQFQSGSFLTRNNVRPFNGTPSSGQV